MKGVGMDRFNYGEWWRMNVEGGGGVVEACDYVVVVHVGAYYLHLFTPSRSHIISGYPSAVACDGWKS